jgi:signal peptidase complex subunit 1
MISLVAGFTMWDIYVTLWTGLALTLLVMLIVVPAWPMYNKHPQKWLGSTGGVIVVGGKKQQ